MLNQYFNHFPATDFTNEQMLVEDLVIESIKQYGMDVYYIPRESRQSIDLLYGEDTLKNFKGAFAIEMYLESIMGMEGNQDLISKFGIELQDEIKLLVSKRRFNQTISRQITKRPREGDLIYVPLVQNFFEIKHVEHENDQAMMYTLGKGKNANIYVYLLDLIQYNFSEEPMNTGIEEVDNQIKSEYRQTLITLTTNANNVGNFVSNELVYQGNTFATAKAKAITYTWNKSNNQLYVTQVVGIFSSENGPIKGSKSGASWYMSGTGDNLTPLNNAFEDIVDNKRIETEGNFFINFSETNPFGEP